MFSLCNVLSPSARAISSPDNDYDIEMSENGSVQSEQLHEELDIGYKGMSEEEYAEETEICQNEYAKENAGQYDEDYAEEGDVYEPDEYELDPAEKDEEYNDADSGEEEFHWKPAKENKDHHNRNRTRIRKRKGKYYIYILLVY